MPPCKPRIHGVSQLLQPGAGHGDLDISTAAQGLSRARGGLTAVGDGPQKAPRYVPGAYHEGTFNQWET
ncbi:hypothetical protein ColTof4_03052 [Colletotrichum tofieldiae]|nr:hypothetical protein ColTof3_13543 [Colletotrichum tofieldiae]GKT70629.1 hypothetical protein ColTof4_03052 [Colletotrichum tofieldiae]GKT94498.1 hypothetical protein Ct61P_12348 [Colletotrichum tofieldiae]